MDKILSARVDEAVLHKIGLLARKLGTSKKAVIERAILELAAQMESDGDLDPMALALGAWAREEEPEETVARAREAFRGSMERHTR